MSPVFEHGGLRLYLLKLLGEQPRHGYDLMQELKSRFGGLYAPSAGTIYPRLARLAHDGLVEQLDAEGGRKTYRLTEAGMAELAARAAELAALESQVVGSARDLAREIQADVRASVRDLRGELRTAAREARRSAKAGFGSGRTAPGWPGPSAGVREELDSFVRELVNRLGDLDEEQVRRLRVVLKATADAVLRSVGRAS